MIISLTNEVVFSFGGPNLCLLGSEDDFRMLAVSIADLTIPNASYRLELGVLEFAKREGENRKIFFSSKPNAISLGKFNEVQDLIFELDPRYWERIFKYFVFMSWAKNTYYLNAYEDCLSDFDLEQECNFICSSGYKNL